MLFKEYVWDVETKKVGTFKSSELSLCWNFQGLLCDDVNYCKDGMDLTCSTYDRGEMHTNIQ